MKPKLTGSPDRRVQRTRKQLYDALVTLILARGYDTVVVQDILDEANVGRSTFYAHFRDKDALLVSAIQRLEDMLRQVQDSDETQALAGDERVIGFSLAMFEHAHDSRRLYRALLGSEAASIVHRRIEKVIAEVVRREAKKLRSQRPALDGEVPRELLVHYVASTFMSVLAWWLDQRTLLPPKVIHAHFRALVLPTLVARENALQ
jgi:AcrR family transcriptional regulator